MEGKLRLNEIGRWEIVDELDIRLELTSGVVIDVQIDSHWITTRIECGWNERTKTSEYYAVTVGIRLCNGLPARAL